MMPSNRARDPLLWIQSPSLLRWLPVTKPLPHTAMVYRAKVADNSLFTSLASLAGSRARPLTNLRRWAHFWTSPLARLTNRGASLRG